MTDISRRSVIGAGAAAIAAGALGVGGPLADAGAVASADPTYTSGAALYRRPRFAALRGKRFSITGGGKGFPVTLVEVADLDGAPAGAAEQFRLALAARSAVPAQGTYTLRRAGFTATSLFLVPDPAGGGLTAIINSAR